MVHEQIAERKKSWYYFSSGAAACMKKNPGENKFWIFIFCREKVENEFVGKMRVEQIGFDLYNVCFLRETTKLSGFFLLLADFRFRSDNYSFF